MLAVLAFSPGVLAPPGLVLPASNKVLRAPVPVGQMNSDSRPTEEYFDFLLGRNQKDLTVDQPSIIVGSGRVGTLLAQLGNRRGFDDLIVRRGDPIPADHPGPIYICTRNDDLSAVVAQCPEEKRPDLVFLQNGMLEPFRQRYGLYENTQAMLWLAVVRTGGKPLDGITSECPEGLTGVTGKWSGALAARLRTGELVCLDQNERDYRRNSLEKLIWISSFMLVGAINGGITVGQVESKHKELVHALIRELASMCRYTLSVALKTGLEERLCAYSRQVEFFPTALKEFKWRNGWFYRYTRLSTATINRNGLKIEMPDPCPLHTELLEIAQEQGLIDLGEYQDTEVRW